jgi:hypothetical protein
MKRILLLLTLLLTINAKADNKSVEIEMVATAYVEPIQTNAAVIDGRLSLGTGTSKIDEQKKALVYLKFKNTGKAKFELLVSNGKNDRKIEVTFNGLKNEINVPVTTEYQWITVLDGTAQGNPDYSCMTIRNLTAWNIYIQTLRITADEKVIEGVSYGLTERDRLAPYVVLSYQYEPGKSYEYFYNEVTVQEGCDLHGSYFATLNWSGVTNGYSGLHANEMILNAPGSYYDNALMFALWNTELRNDDDIEYRALPYRLGSEAATSRFWWEDYGVRIWGLKMDWKTEKTYCFLINAQISTKVKGSTKTATDTTFYTLYWKEKGEQSWRFHGTIMSPYNGKYLSAFSSFLENNDRSTGYLFRKARYANQWVKSAEDGWEELLSVGVYHDNRFGVNRTDRGVYPDGNGYVVWSGGYLPENGRVGRDFTDTTKMTPEYHTREPSNTPPITAEDEQFFTRSFSTAISQIRNPKKVEYYDLNGNKVKDLRKHQIYITNTGEKVIFSR